MSYTLKNILSSQPPNPNVGYNHSWVSVETNANRTLYSQATYITNLDDLVISLSTNDVTIGDVHITDQNTSLPVSVADIGGGTGALRVLSQDLTPTNDTISLADKSGNNVTVNSSTSSINVNLTNAPNVSAQGLATIQHQLTANTLLNVLTSEIKASNTFLNTLTAQTYVGTTSATPCYVYTPPTKPLSIQYADNSTIDGMGKLRVSIPTTAFESKALHNKSSLFWSQTAVGNSFVGFTGNGDSSITLSAYGNSAYAIRQTSQRFQYKPGKSQICIFSGIMNPVSNAVKRGGLFTSLTSAPFTPNCGLYFETQTDSPSSLAVIQNNVGGLVPSVSARREDWNLDKLDGSGISGKSLTLSAANIFVIDFLWLGVGRVRFGFILDGIVYYCHEIKNSGNVMGAYMVTPNLPFRTEIRQTDIGTCDMKLICCSIIVEDDSQFGGYTLSISNSSVQTINSGDRRATLGLRLKSQRLDTVNQLVNVAAIAIPDTSGNTPNNGICKYEVLFNPYTNTSTIGVTGGSWNDVSPDSNFQYWNGNNQPYNGIVLASGFTTTGTTIDLTGYNMKDFVKLGCSIDGIRDEVYLVLTPLQANLGVHSSITFMESD